LTRTLRPFLMSRFCIGALATALLACTPEGNQEEVDPSGPCGEEKRCFEMRFWETPLRGEDYPEMADAKIQNRASFGIAFSGGGNRAAPAALGQLRALHDLGWIDRARYLSAISGGSWSMVPYTWLKDGCDAGIGCDEELFLGRMSEPQEVALKIPGIDREGPGFERGSMLGAISNAQISKRMVRAWSEGRFDESYAQALGEIYLEPFGLWRDPASADQSLFTWHSSDRVRIEKIPRFEGTEIHEVERDRPYLIVGGAALTRRASLTADTKFRSEFTPLYSGVPQAVDVVTKGWDGAERTYRLGGGFVESAGFDYVTVTSLEKQGQTWLRLTDPQYGSRTDEHRLNFSLSDVIAVSGAAPVETILSSELALLILPWLVPNVGFPEMHVPVRQGLSGRHPWFAFLGTLGEREWSMGDGGHEDNLGMMPLLARQVEHILAFVNAPQPAHGMDRVETGSMTTRTDACAESLKTARHRETEMVAELNSVAKACSDLVGTDIASLFYITPTEDKFGGAGAERIILGRAGKRHNIGLRLLENDGGGYPEALRPYVDYLTVARDILEGDNLSCREYRWMPGFPSSADRTHDPGAVRNWTDQSSYEPTICFSYLDRDEAWFETVCQELQQGGMTAEEIGIVRKALDLDDDPKCSTVKRQRSKSDGFPHIATFFDAKPNIIDTDPARLFALHSYTAWGLKTRADQIRKSFAESGLQLP